MQLLAGVEYGDLFSESPYSVQMRENADQKKAGFEHISHSGWAQLNTVLLTELFLRC